MSSTKDLFQSRVSKLCGRATPKMPTTKTKKAFLGGNRKETFGYAKKRNKIIEDTQTSQWSTIDHFYRIPPTTACSRAIISTVFLSTEKSFTRDYPQNNGMCLGEAFFVFCILFLSPSSPLRTPCDESNC